MRLLFLALSILEQVEMKVHPHPERPDRLRAIAASLATAGVLFNLCLPSYNWIWKRGSPWVRVLLFLVLFLFPSLLGKNACKFLICLIILFQMLTRN